MLLQDVLKVLNKARISHPDDAVLEYNETFLGIGQDDIVNGDSILQYSKICGIK